MREEEKKRSSQDSNVKHFFKKRWAFPAVYIASAAIILTAVLWYQNSNSATDSEQFDYEANDIAGKKHNEPAVEVNKAIENIAMPVTNPDSVVIQKQFYDYEGTKEEQEAALVFYNNTYHPNTGIDITMKNGETFDVVAALSGTVTKVENDSLLGNVIEIQHDKGIVTQYQSVKDMKVKVGDQVDQGQALAQAGQSLYNEEAAVHVHFEIRKDNVPLNPIDFFNKPFSALQQADVSNKAAAEENGSSEDSVTDEEANKEPEKTMTDENADKEESGQKEDESTESGDTEKDKEDSTEDGSESDKKEGAESTDSSDA